VRCDQARQLFDAYLDGELSSALETELGAHRLKCASCRRELALLEVAGHVLRSDVSDPAASGDFTDRLLRCVEQPSRLYFPKLRRGLYIAGSMAAAAVILLAFAGLFDGRGASKVAGVQEVNPGAVRAPLPSVARPIRSDLPDSPSSFEDWLRQTEQNVESGRKTGESLQNALDNTFSQFLKLLEDDSRRAAEPSGVPKEPSKKKEDEVEDM
jgi:anti-sigma factor RsiW